MWNPRPKTLGHDLYMKLLEDCDKLQVIKFEF